jgi:hypothetical protein
MDGDGGILQKQQGGQIDFQGKSDMIRRQSGAPPLSRSCGGELLPGGQAMAEEHSLGVFAALFRFRCNEAKLVLSQIASGNHDEFDGKAGTVHLLDDTHGSELLDAHLCGGGEAIYAAVPRMPQTDPAPDVRQVFGKQAIVAGLEATIGAQAFVPRAKRFHPSFQNPHSPLSQ